MNELNGTIYWGRFLLPFDDDVSALEQGAVHVPTGADLIDDLGPLDELRAKHPGAREIGAADRVVMPGLIDAHQHGRALSPADQGCWDETLELWLAQQRAVERPDPVLSAQVAAIRSLLDGVTTIMHPHVSPNPAQAIGESIEIVRVYRSVGIRAIFGLDLRDRASYAYDDDVEFLARIPAAAQRELGEHMAPAAPASLSDLELAVATLRHEIEGAPITIGLAPRGPQWCTPALLEWAAEQSRGGLPLQVHASETRAQYGWFAQHGDSPIRHLQRHGLLSPRTTLAHCVWLDAADTEAIAESGAVVAHNPASNLRLQSGQAPIAHLRALGIPIAIGTDSTGLGSRPELFGEIRLARWLEQLALTPTAISPASALRDALRGGAAAAGDRDRLGVLRIGAAADLVLLDYEGLTARAAKNLDPAEVVAERAQRTSVTDVVVAGQHLVAGGRYLVADHAALEDALVDEAGRLRGDPGRAAAVRTLRPLLSAELERLHEVGRGARFVGRPTA